MLLNSQTDDLADFQEAYKPNTRDIETMGMNLKEMLVTCSYDGKACNLKT